MKAMGKGKITHFTDTNTHTQAHILDVGIVCEVIASLILNGDEMVHLLPYKPCEFSDLPPPWISTLSLLPLSVPPFFPLSLHTSLILVHSQSQTYTQRLSLSHTHTHTAHTYPALCWAVIVMLLMLRVYLCIWSVHPQELECKIPD